MKYLAMILIICSSAFSKVILTEILFNPAGNENNDEFIEIYNSSDSSVDLAGWSVGDQDDTDLLLKYHGFSDMILKPYSYCVIMDSSYYISSVYYEDLIPDSVLRVMINDGSIGAYGLSNTYPETVRLINNYSAISDSVIYSIDQNENYSDERISFEMDDWANSKIERGTPGFKNSVFPLDYDLVLKTGTFPQVIDPNSQNSFVMNIKNIGIKTVSGLRLNAYINNILTASNEYTAELARGDSVLSEIMLNFETSGTVQIRFDIETEFDDDTSNNIVTTTVFVPFSSPPLVLNEFMSIPNAEQCEYIEIYNISGNPVNLGDFGLSDEVKTRVIYFPDSIVPPDSYVVMAKNSFIYNFPDVITSKVFITAGLATLNNDIDKVFLLSKNGSVVDSIAYSGFSLTGKSVEKRGPWLDSPLLSNWAQCSSAGTPTVKNTSMPFDYDFKAASVTIPEVIAPAEFNRFVLKIKNVGLKVSAEFKVSAYINGVFATLSQNAPAPAPGDSLLFGMDLFFEYSGTVQIRFDLASQSDENPDNDSISVSAFVPFPKPPLVLNEFMKNPAAGQCEYIELYNISGDTINIGDFGLSDEVKTTAVFFPDSLILPDSYIVLAKDTLIYNFTGVIRQHVFISSKLPALNNAYDKIFLLTKDKQTADSIYYDDLDDDPGRSIEKIYPGFNSADLNNWHYCVEAGTPTGKNSIYQKPEDAGSSAHFKISPRTATPNGDGENDNLLISYEFDSSYIYLTMKIFNIKGRLIAKPLNGDYSSGKGNIVWSCRDENGTTADTGAYICLLKAKDDNGKVVELKEAFYIAK